MSDTSMRDKNRDTDKDEEWVKNDIRTRIAW